jgi:hypothetical protein
LIDPNDNIKGANIKGVNIESVRMSQHRLKITEPKIDVLFLQKSPKID